jgi:hypothetical protein
VSARKDGGPAFQSERGAIPMDASMGHHHGISLRDHFAGKAMQELVGNKVRGHLDYGNEIQMSSRAYEIADAMLAARQEPPAPDLLEACEAVDRDIEAGGVVTAESIEKLRFALAKARRA